MQSPGDQLRTIGLIAAHEHRMAELYSAYAAKFPASADLFSKLAADERDHALRISLFAADVRATKVRINPERFPAATVLSSLDSVQSAIRQVQTSEVALVRALSVAYDFENSLIESRYFEIVEGDSDELRSLLQHLDTETAKHRDLVRQALEKERQRSS